MIKVHLTEDNLWRGVTYLKGDREIPEDLAIALGIQEEAKPPEQLTPDPTPESTPEPPKTTTRRKRGS